jgi:phosphodiesterase/alkaline phosphatase D-like protein
MFAQWDDHEVTDDWSPQGSYDDRGYDENGNSRLIMRARRAFFDYMSIRERSAEGTRVYRRIGYGPLLDVFLIDCAAIATIAGTRATNAQIASFSAPRSSSGSSASLRPRTRPGR